MKGLFRVAFFACMMAVFSVSRGWAVASSTGWLEVAGDKLYIAGIGHGFHMFDISNPVKPKWVGSWNNHTCPVGVQVVDGLAYLANRTSGFEVIDVSDPAAPVRIGHLSTGGDLQTVQVSGSHAYVADLKRGFDIIDISNPKRPKLDGDFETKGQGWCAFADGDHAYVSYNGSILRTYQLQNGTNPRFINETPYIGGKDLQMINGKLLSQHFQMLCLLDVQNPANPLVATDSRVPLPVFWSACVRGSRAFLTGGNMGLGIYNFGAEKIQLLGSVEVGYQGHGVDVSGNYAYVVDGGANLHIFDVSNPAKPVEINRVGTENFCSQVLSLADEKVEKSSAAISNSVTAITNAPPELAGATRMTDGSFSFSLRGVPGGVYDIQASTDLVHWTVISTSTLPETGVLTISDPDARLFSNRFYRAIKQP